MALLLNRKFGSRIECLYYILQSVYAKFGVRKTFTLNDFKYDENDEDNVHKYCKLLKSCIGKKCCPYLDSVVDPSKCYAVRSKTYDTMKSKSVSDIAGSLEALGFITRLPKREFKISSTGEKWIKTRYDSAEWEDLVRDGVLSYGVAIGFLSRISKLPDIFSTTDIYLGYPDTKEFVDYINNDGNVVKIRLSTDSEKDSSTRAKTRIIAWCVTTGLLEPVGVAGNESTLAHIKYRDFLNAKKMGNRKYKKTELCKHVFDDKHFVKNPLSYVRLHKDVKSQREYGGEDIRNATMQNLAKILNRRYVLIYALNLCSVNNRPLNLDKLVSVMNNHSDDFFVEGNDSRKIMHSECDIAELAGIPYKENEDGNLLAMTTIDVDILNESAPESTIKLAKTIMDEMRKNDLQ